MSRSLSSLNQELGAAEAAAKNWGVGWVVCWCMAANAVAYIVFASDYSLESGGALAGLLLGGWVSWRNQNKHFSTAAELERQIAAEELVRAMETGECPK